MNIGIIGDGQLGRMLALEGMKLGHSFGFLSSKESIYHSPCKDIGTLFTSLAGLVDFADVLTYEYENIDISTLNNIAIPIHPALSILEIAQHRILEKTLFASLNIPYAPYQVYTPSSAHTLREVLNIATLPVIIKTTTQGYDGKGQYIVKHTKHIDKAITAIGDVEVIIEDVIPFDYEISLLTCASKDEIIHYPLTKNTHKNGILHTSTVIDDAKLLAQAQQYATAICQKFGYIGILTIEFFVVQGKLYANEIAPRVHNSGHWTITGAHTSQFENHIRALTSTPLGATATPYKSVVMHNIIGTLPDINTLLQDPHISLYIYNKTARPKRKLGHYCICK